MSGIVVIDVERGSQIGVVIWNDNRSQGNAFLQRSNGIAIGLVEGRRHYNAIILVHPSILKAEIIAL